MSDVNVSDIFSNLHPVPANPSDASGMKVAAPAEVTVPVKDVDSKDLITGEDTRAEHVAKANALAKASQ